MESQQNKLDEHFRRLSRRPPRRHTCKHRQSLNRLPTSAARGPVSFPTVTLMQTNAGTEEISIIDVETVETVSQEQAEQAVPTDYSGI